MKRLELTSTEFGKRAANFANLMSDRGFRKKFFSDPAGTAMREFQLKGPAATVSASNKLFAALLRDKTFGKWCAEFQRSVEAEYPAIGKTQTVAEAVRVSKRASARIQRDFVDGVVKHLSPALAKSLLRDKDSLQIGLVAAEDDIAIFLLVFVAVVVVAVLGQVEEPILSRNTVRLLLNQIAQIQATLGQAR
jgi:hypothetical protein